MKGAHGDPTMLRFVGLLRIFMENDGFLCGETGIRVTPDGNIFDSMTAFPWELM